MTAHACYSEEITGITKCARYDQIAANSVDADIADIQISEAVEWAQLCETRVS